MNLNKPPENGILSLIIPSLLLVSKKAVDRCTYMKVSGSKFIFLILYVDDRLLTVNDFGLLYETKKHLFKNFEMKNMGEATCVIGI